jgi:Transposase DDE domain
MLTEDFIINTFVCIDDALKSFPEAQTLRKRGFLPQLADSEVLTMESVGEFLGLDDEKAIWQYFRTHWLHFFPKLGVRTTLTRQMANLALLKQAVWHKLSVLLGAYRDPVHLFDGFPVAACQFRRAPRCQRLRGLCAYGYCAAKGETYYGLHGHLCVSSQGVISGFALTAANVDERDTIAETLRDTTGLVIADKGLIRPALTEQLARCGIALQTPLRSNMQDPRPKAFVRWLVSTRRLVETVIGQLNQRFHIESTKARDQWHLTSRFARKILAHTVAVFINVQQGRPPLQFDGLITA